MPRVPSTQTLNSQVAKHLPSANSTISLAVRDFIKIILNIEKGYYLPLPPLHNYCISFSHPRCQPSLSTTPFLTFPQQTTLNMQEQEKSRGSTRINVNMSWHLMGLSHQLFYGINQRSLLGIELCWKLLLSIGFTQRVMVPL